MRKDGSKVAWASKETEGGTNAKSNKEMWEKKQTHERARDCSGRGYELFLCYVVYTVHLHSGGRLSPVSVSQWFLICALSGGVRRGYAAEPCEHGSTETLRGRSNYHCMCNHKSRTITHTIRHLLTPGFLFCRSAWGAYRQLRHELRDRHDWLDQLLWSVKGQIFHSLGSLSGLFSWCSV